MSWISRRVHHYTGMSIAERRAMHRPVPSCAKRALQSVPFALRFPVMGLLAFALVSPAFAKREAPAAVAPVVHDSVRYEAPAFSAECRQNGGCIVAYDNDTGAQLWTLRVYCTEYEPGLETDVQDVFITSLTARNGHLEVANEKDRHFSIDPRTRAVSGDDTGCGSSGGGAGCNASASRSRPGIGTAVLAIVLLTAIFARRQLRHVTRACGRRCDCACRRNRRRGRPSWRAGLARASR